MLKLRELPFGLYEKSISNDLSWEDKFHLINEAGYDYLEIAIDATPERLSRLDDRQEMLRIRRASEKLDVPLYTFAFTANRFFPIGSEDHQIRDRGVELLKSAINFAAFVGSKTINICSYDEYERPRNLMTEAYFRQSLEKCVSHAAIRGVIISLETMDTDFMDTTRKAMEYVRAFDSAFLQVGVDPGNITAMGHNPVSDFPIAGRHIVEVEFKDVKLGNVRDIRFGEGVLDFDACFRALHDIGYQGFLAAEMWSHDDPANNQYIFSAFEFLKAKMADY